MADNNFTFKNFKPTLKPASDMGKKIDSGFKNKMRNAGVNMSNIHEEEKNKSKEPSLKKKIFSLPKMETLVMTDDYLSNIFNKLKTDAQETYGYHWNETIMNIMFNEYVLDDAAYLQKYKNTKTYNKKRRGQEGVEELEKNLQDKIDNDKDEKPEFNRDEKLSDVETNKDQLKKFKQDMGNDEEKPEYKMVAEEIKKSLSEMQQVDELFGFGKPSVPLTTHKASKNDTYLVRKKDNTAVGVISPNLTPQQNQETATKFADPMQYEKMPWYVAVTKQVKGVPAEVTDGSMEDFQADANKYAGVPAMQEGNQISAKFTGEVDDWSNKLYKGSDGNLYVEVDGQLHSMTSDGEPLAPARNVIKMDENIDSANKTKMTAGDGFELQFSKTTAADAEEAALKDSTYHNEVIYQNETTTSASSGAFVGPFSGKRKAVLDKPLWHGGTMIKEAKDYITNPEAFKRYVLMVESVDKLESMLKESVDEGSGISIKQHAENILSQLERMKSENPDLNQLPEFNDLINIYTSRAQTGKVENEPVTVPQQKPAPVDNTKQWSNMNENPSFDDAMAKDLKYTGNKVSSNEPQKELESQDGLFKGRWNTNESVNEKAVSKSQQKFMGMVHAAQKGELKNPSPEVAKAADSMSDKSAEDFAATKYNGLPNHVKHKNETMETSNDSGLNERKKHFQSKLQKEKKNWSKMSPEERKKFTAEVIQEVKLQNESMVDDQPDSMARTMDSPELNTAGTGGASSSSVPVEENDIESSDVETAAQGDRQDKEAIADAAKFREFLMSKYGVDSVADMSPRQKQQVMKDLAASKGDVEQPKAKPELDLKNFAATDAQRAEYKARDAKQLSFVAAHNNEVNSLQDYIGLEKLYAQENGEKMFHPMAILASIQAMPPEERMKYNNVEKVLNGKLKGGIEENKLTKNTASMNEERQTPSQLNLQNIKKETAALTKKDMANADALKQARVYPNPDEFYIEQDADKIHEFKTGAELEAEALKKVEELKALQNAGNSTNDNGKEIVKRNLTKEEMLKLAMDRGDGMHNIVYDNKPSDKFEKRLEKDMGEDQYKLRQEKMKYREDAPAYNKDTQPTENGDKKFQDDKYKVGFNEAFTGKYTDHNGKVRLVEFMLGNVKEVSSIDGGFRLTLDGLGNKYTVKINENKTFESDEITKYHFYLLEGEVVKIMTPNDKKEMKKDAASSILEDSMKRMSHLIGYSAGDFVNTKKSVKF